ncbi:taurine ABC transporter substrate-binding protein [Acinetobacter bohemicus]|uniref:taurine ABC transporter substrate-binding protein n=1 Tax=Acinetobacter TaxID=469 RepID=UPI00209AD740|nr:MULTISPECIES: taurine ABC transporter substrate-binding protein [Acinetobacter]MCO8043036.1 taurine ABC transporter substrate-binding protein [Acinetobacter sp. S4400-12]MCU7225442.1 taurine ABC transporter substrate-binding protein [Acinetobacter bohemicus]
MSRATKPLIVTVIVVIAIATFIYFQAKKLDMNPQAVSKNDKPVVIAYQTGIDPTKIAQAKGEYEKDSGNDIQWKKFDTGADVVNALASGDVDIGNIGSSPVAAAASHDLPIEVFFVAAKLGSSEALVVNNKAGIQSPADLKGKTIAVPFVSTAHYSLLSALKHWNIDESEVKIINLRPPEISAAWERGDIEAAYVWEPALSKLLASGKSLADSKQVADWGAPTYDVWVVRKDFAEKKPEFLKSFVQTSLNTINEYQQDPEEFKNNTEYLARISELTGSNAKDIPLLLSGNIYLDKEQQQQLFVEKFAKNILDTAEFLKSQGKVDKVKQSYQTNVNASFLKP